MVGIECLLCFGGRDVSAGLKQSAVVEPIDPFEGFPLDPVDGASWCSPADDLGFVKPVDGLGQGSVIGITDASNRGFPSTRHQRCWFHKSSNVLNKFPKSMVPTVTTDLQNFPHAETKVAALAAIEVFKEKYGSKTRLPSLA